MPRSIGTSLLQRGIACGQRGWKWQPDGGVIGLGISPRMVLNAVRRWSMRGISASSARVYGWFGRANS